MLFFFTMFKIPQIEKGSYYIDRAMDSMGEFATKTREQIGERFKNSPTCMQKSNNENNLNKRKDLELEKIKFLNDRINTTLKKVTKRFPRFKRLDDIYIKLINTGEVKVRTIEDNIKRMQWICNSIDELTQNTEMKLKKTRSNDTCGFIMKKYLGKVNSYFRKEKHIFTELEEARKFMNKMPEFQDLFTVSIAGFPNVGKSTLMKNITGCEVDIQPYPFTTKGLMFGYIEKKNVKQIQLIDTPGLLNRDTKHNDIEQRARIIVNEYCDSIVFVLDFTESCGYNIKSQIKLLKQTRDSGKDMVLYLSKKDLFNEEIEELLEENSSMLKKYKVFDNFEVLKEYIVQLKENTKKFDIRDIKVIK